MAQASPTYQPPLFTPSLDDPVNVASVPQRSPFRYPGGKTWLVPHVRRWLLSQPRRPRLLIEPFAGGGIIGLTAAFEALAEHVMLVELDENVGAVWETILAGDGSGLAQRIVDFELSAESVRAVFAEASRSEQDVAFRTLLKNRVQHGGILAPGASLMSRGENGKGLRSRWYPGTLARRIRDIVDIREGISFRCADAFDVLRRHVRDRTTTFFIDPPYTVAGRRLYAHCEIDHERLFYLASRLRGAFMMTYDDCPEVRRLAERYRLATTSVAMRSRQHTDKRELIVCDDLSWAHEANR